MSVKLMSGDGQVFESPKEEIEISTTVKDLIESFEGSDEAIPMPNVKSRELGKIVEYCKQWKAEPRTPENDFSKPTQELKFSEWELDFIPKNQNQLFELIMAANFMNIESLINLCCAYVASLIKGKTTEEMREALAMDDEEEEEETS